MLPRSARLGRIRETGSGGCAHGGLEMFASLSWLRVAIAVARESEDDDETDHGQNRQNEDAAFGAGASSSHKRSAKWMRGEKMVLHHESTISNTIEKGLGPVPRGVETNRPPQRASAPQTEAEAQAGKAGGEQADGRLARIVSVTKTEEHGEGDRGCPKTERLTTPGLE